MATAALVRDVFGSDSDTDDARDAREASTEARDAIESVPARAPFKSSLELDDDDDDARRRERWLGDEASREIGRARAR